LTHHVFTFHVFTFHVFTFHVFTHHSLSTVRCQPSTVCGLRSAVSRSSRPR
jgi:hypothetical protein